VGVSGFGGLQADPAVDCLDAVRTDDDGTQLELADLRQVLDRPGDPEQHVPQHGQVCGRGAAAKEAAITGQPASLTGGRSLSCLRHRRLPQGRINAVVARRRRASRVNNNDIGGAPDERLDRRYGDPLKDSPVQRDVRSPGSGWM
jgi:hypothetical protein